MSDWKEWFNKRWGYLSKLHVDYECLTKDVESLLSKQQEQHVMKMAAVAAQADQKLTIYRAGVVERVEKLKKIMPTKKEYQLDYSKTYNKALDEVLSLLREELV